MKMARAPRSAATWAILGAALLMAAVALRQDLEQTMTRHMLVQIPMLLVAGIACSRSMSALQTDSERLSRLEAWNAHGLTGLLVFLLTTAYWMIPRALDSAVACAAAELAKMLSLFVAGFLLPASLARANTILQLFFLGNFASMMAIVGMLYQDAPQRLCNFYLVDDQVWAGMGLVTLAVVLPLLWCLCLKSVRDYFTGKKAG
ncbi:hypothetical protein [Noviherbaspirillum autotrophicum]|uniref:hypothetical protein n=1 Tax=Noviherbaspirillum autotrophicum TaxID=709839 RepID=UPI000AE5763F|nr:hypothetical protein [Noviherbaspirillum autotrophicum]